ncbi:MAG: SusC/RagA family TonB-linked outer membrane protein [Bacteroidetes bacterium]|nr:MAG: SusC/RagA family TonB-linked outer membrane protein [Bacteroidota bacterium]
MRKSSICARWLLLLLLGMGFSFNSHAQTSAVVGKVTDQQGEGIPYATVQLKGTKIAAVANEMGDFSINLPAGKKNILVFSSAGFEKKEVEVVGGTVNAQLTSGTALSEVVVTAFGVKQQKKSLGFATSEVSSKQLLESKQPNLINALQGRVPGVQVNSTGGAPGQGARIVIRGLKSALGSNQPLFVIDGAIVDNSTVTEGGSAGGRGMSNRMSDINPDDVESMSILRGGAATALYGFRGSNGVVVITTKSAKAGKMRVTYNATYGIEEVNKFPEVQSTFTQGYRTGGRVVYNPNDFFPSWGPTVAEARSIDPTHPEKLYNHYAQAYDQGNQFRNTINLSGGNDKALISSSFSYMKHNGVLPNTNYSNIGARVNANLKVSSKLSINPSFNFINSGGIRYNADRFNESLTYWSPRWNVRDYKNADGSHKTYGNNNPIFGAYYNEFKDDVNRLLSNIAANYTPVSWLNLTYRLGYDFSSDNRRATAPGQIARPGVINFADNPLGFVGEYRVINKVLNSNFIATANFKAGKDWEFTLRGGQDLVENNYNYQGVDGTELDIVGLTTLNNARQITQNSRRTQLRTIGLFSEASVSFRDYVFLSATGRNDWASSVAGGNQSFFYPSVSLGYVFSSHFKLPEFISYGKFRASFARIGIAPVTPYLTSTYYNNAFGQPLNGVNGWTRDDVKGAESLKPEFTDNREVGLEMQFFAGRLGFDATYYQINSKDVVNRVLVPTSTGFSSNVLNSGEIENKGWEIAVNAIPLRTKNFKWEFNFNYTGNQNRVVSLAPGLSEIVIASQFGYLNSAATQKWVVGQPAGGLYGTSYARFYNGAPDNRITLGQNLPFLIGNTGAGAGFPMRDLNQRLLGNSLPRSIFGVSNSFTYKGIGLSVLFDMRNGVQRYNQLSNFMSAFGIAKYTEDRNTTKVFEGVTADGRPNTQPVFMGMETGPDGRNYGDGFYRLIHRGVTENFIEDAGWVRLRTLSLSYNLPASWLARTKLVKEASLTFTGNNLWLNTPFTGFDPENSSFSADSNADGFAGFTYPGVRSYLFTINVAF